MVWRGRCEPRLGVRLTGKHFGAESTNAYRAGLTRTARAGASQDRPRRRVSGQPERKRRSRLLAGSFMVEAAGPGGLRELDHGAPAFADLNDDGGDDTA
jgi:hypothetical protein